MEPELMEAQQLLMDKRKQQKVVSLPTPVNRILPAVSPIEVMNGELIQHEACKYHHSEPLPCQECETQAREAEERKSRKEKIEVERILGGIKLGKRYQGVSFDDYKPTCPDAQKIKAKCYGYAKTFKDRLEACDCLLMLGKPGTGKNMLSAAICNHIAQNGFTALHTTAMRLVRRIRETWRKDSRETEQDVIDSFKMPDLLVVDEIGVQLGTADEKLRLFEAINGRYEDEKPTILISNLDMVGVERYLDIPMVDRFHEGKSAVLEFTWESYRRRKD